MSEYTPTTDEVRSSFGNDFVLDETTTTADALPMFDRWLIEHDRQVAADAWDEGNLAAWHDGEEAENPYREEADHVG